MTSRQDKLDAAEKAKSLMRSDLMVDFFERAERQLYEQWKSVATDEDAQRELHLKYLGLLAFKEFMHVVLIDGQEARRELDRTNP